jgi:hypothetical protein
VVTPDVAFQQAANAAAAVYEQAPPWLTYRTTAHIEVKSMNRRADVMRDVKARTRDDLAIMQDLPQGATRVGHSFPLLPTFDALSYFRLVGSGGPHKALDSYVTDVKPLHYNGGVSTSGADVVVTNLKYYYAKYADDSTDDPNGKTHITLRPLPTLLRNYSGNLFFNDLVIDNQTHLPVRVVFTGLNDRTFAVDYVMVQNHWLVNHAFYEETDYGPLHVGRVHFTVNATFDQFGFPATAPDPRLAKIQTQTAFSAPSGIDGEDNIPTAKRV